MKHGQGNYDKSTRYYAPDGDIHQVTYALVSQKNFEKIRVDLDLTLFYCDDSAHLKMNLEGYKLLLTGNPLDLPLVKKKVEKVILKSIYTFDREPSVDEILSQIKLLISRTTEENDRLPAIAFFVFTKVKGKKQLLKISPAGLVTKITEGYISSSFEGKLSTKKISEKTFLELLPEGSTLLTLNK
jgi:hypothetical protein